MSYEVTSEDITDVISAALWRYDMGMSTKGPYSTGDDRDLFKEIEDELLDNINYSIFKIVKLRELRREYAGSF